MAKQKQTNSVDILKPIQKLWKRFHLTLFFVLIVGGLSGAILLINNTLKDTSLDPNYSSPINAGTIDKVTLDRLNTLHTSTQGTPAPALPTGRVNPVGE